MARVVLVQSFPSLDEEVVAYITGIVDGEDGEFETVEDVKDLVAPLLEGLGSGVTGADIEAVCHDLFKLVNMSGEPGTSSGKRVLDAPLSFATMNADTKEFADGTTSSIWMENRANVSKVDKKKLEKAEAKIKQKQEKREGTSSASAQNGKSADSSATATSESKASVMQQINRKDVKMDQTGTNMTRDFKIENFDISYGELTLLKDANVSLNYGRRYGLVGRNGRGKSTLLKMISEGSLRIPSHIRVLHVEQEVVGDDTLAVQSVLESDIEREALIKEERSLNEVLNKESNSAASSRLAAVYHRLEEMEADRAPSRVAQILSGLGFTTAMQQYQTRQFSGGWRMRLALARALFSKPDLLLLDEPTNMLDIKAIIWLENYLQSWSSTILVVSHDRSFLSAVATDIFYLFSQKVEYFRGNYDQFESSRENMIKNLQREYDAQKEYRDHIQVFIDRFRYNANRAAQVQSKLKLLEKLPVIVPVVPEPDVTLKFPEPHVLQGTVLRLDEIHFQYSPELVIFKGVDISATPESRICIVGENGTGKTTLLKILLGDLEPSKGLRHCHRSLRLGYFSQHHVDQLEMGVTSVELLAQRFPGKPQESYRNVLGQFGVSGDLALRQVDTLSGGQKSRVAFAAMAMSNPNFLILDEPTNHLDVETVEALGKALNNFKGGVVLVSHDESLISIVCKELWVCGGGKVTSLDGGIKEYRRLVEKELASQ